MDNNKSGLFRQKREELTRKLQKNNKNNADKTRLLMEETGRLSSKSSVIADKIRKSYDDYVK